MLKEIIKQMILDFQNMPFENIVKRELKIYPVSKKALVCVGVRRCGKSTFMFQIMQDLVSTGVKKENILYINFFDDRIAELRQAGPSVVLDVYFSIYPEKKNSEKIHCFFDELQETSKWEMFVERILRTELCEVYITGSSSKMLSKEISTEMRGRSLTYELFPFSFREFLMSQNICVSPVTTKEKLIVGKAFEEYFEKGGFPETIFLSKHSRIRIHQEYFRGILLHDIVERFDAPNPQTIIQMGTRLVTSVASLYSVNRLTEYLKSTGFKASKEFISQALNWFDDCYFLFSVQIFDQSLVRRQVNLKKIYCVDHSFVESIDPNVSEKKGHLLENVIFLSLKRKSSKIFYYRTSTGKEVDFYWFDESNKGHFVQVSLNISDPKTFKRELSALAEAMNETGVLDGVIVSFDEKKEIEENGKTINIVPAWEYLINL